MPDGIERVLRRRWILAAVIGLLWVGLWYSHAVGQAEVGPSSAQPLGAVPAQATDGKLPPGCLQVVSEPGGPITAVVYDPQQQALGVYHVDRATGEIELKSVRQIQWDLRMLHFQGKAPLPEDIKNGLEGARGR